MEERTAVAGFWLHLAVDIVCVVAVIMTAMALFPSMRQESARVGRLEKSVDDRFEVADRRFEKLEALATKWADELHRNHAEEMRAINAIMVSQAATAEQTRYITGYYERAERAYNGARNHAAKQKR